MCLFNKDRRVTSSRELSFARPLERDVPLRRETWVLPDGCETLVLRHVPAGRKGPPVLYVHGIQSHPGWFVGSAQALARAGHEVFQVTRRGSGPAGAGRGDAASARQLLDDVASAARCVLDKSGAEKLALVGVSWGGKLLAAYAPAADAPAATLTLVTPGIVPRVDVSLRTKLAIAAARCCCPRKYFDIPLSDPELFTDNPPMREYLQGDPHRLHRATARFLVASAVLDKALARAPAGSVRLPTTLILARRDRIIDNAATRAEVARLTAGRAEVFELDAAHSIEFEPDVRGFYDLLCRAVAGDREGSVE